MKPAGHQSAPFLLEIGCEEIPARFLEGAREGLKSALETALRGARLLAEDAPPFAAFSTPRRLAVHAPSLLLRQPDQVEEVIGPPVSVAFDASGKPTRAAESFAEKNGVLASKLIGVKTAKGEYVAAKKVTFGRPAMQILEQALPGLIGSLSFPKSMVWAGKAGPRFVRPVRWILALLGEKGRAKPVRFSFAGVEAGNSTRGHRQASLKPVEVTGFSDYLTRLRKLQVEIDPAARRERIRKECHALLEGSGLKPIEDDELEQWLVNSTEWLSALAGGFAERFLALPREILVTVMRDHQKYFAVEDSKGKLAAKFVAILNRQGDPAGHIRRGHERVLAARFADAEFFWKADQRVPLPERRAWLERVTYQAELGSYSQKVARMKITAAEICRLLEGQGRLAPHESAAALRAVELAKCDLTTQMVQELPELQGIVGGLYAQAQGEPPEVAEAIYDHYLPKSLEDSCPRSTAGAVVSLADKLDAVAAGFAVGHEPSGSSDPFALRRQGSGIVKVLLELSLPLKIRPLAENILLGLDIEWRRPRDEVFHSIADFFIERLRYYLGTARGMRYDTVRAVLAAGWDPPLDALRRAEALERVREGGDFEPLSAAAKRIRNILTKSAKAVDVGDGGIAEALLEAGPETELYRALNEVSRKVEELRERGNYVDSLAAIARLRQPVDTFFDRVLVMAENAELRRNRLRMLTRLDGLFSGIAHFAEIAAPDRDVDASTMKTRG